MRMNLTQRAEGQGSHEPPKDHSQQQHVLVCWSKSVQLFVHDILLGMAKCPKRLAVCNKLISFVLHP